MHLITFLEIKQPGPIMRAMVLLSQGVYYNFFFLAYLISPKFCHRLGRLFRGGGAKIVH